MKNVLSLTLLLIFACMFLTGCVPKTHNSAAVKSSNAERLERLQQAYSMRYEAQSENETANSEKQSYSIDNNVLKINMQ